MLQRLREKTAIARAKRAEFITACNTRSPEFILATWFGSGLMIPGPGTWGTLGGMLAGIPLLLATSPLVLLITSCVIFIVGLWAAAKIEKTTQAHDQSFIVIDEVAAIWMVMAAIPNSALLGSEAPFILTVCYIMGFALFRLFDIWKPWPIRLIDKNIGGAWGVMLDDTLAALFAIAAFWIVVFFVIENFVPQIS